MSSKNNDQDDRDESMRMNFYSAVIGLTGADESRRTYRRKVTGMIQELSARMRAAAKVASRSTGLHPSSHVIAVLTYRVNDEHLIKVRELQRGLGFTAGGVTRRLDAMIRDGLIVKEPDPEDGRAQLARLTPRGVALAETLLKETEANSDRVENALTLREWKTLFNLLLRLETEIH